jgi:peptide/nickel transport system ATP-binding protein
MNKDLFNIENLKVAYPNADEKWSVNDVSFALKAGESLGLVGESGCGKSTLGRAAMRLLPDDSRIEGDVKFQGESIFAFDRDRLRRFRGEVVSIVFQDPMTRLDPLMTIGDHCLETLQAHQPQLSRSQAKARAIEALDSVKIPPNRWSQYPHEFSGGMRQRVAIALALLLNPKAIVADEPTTSLDVTVSKEILDELTRLCSEREMALLLISHDLATIGEYCDRVAVMYHGNMVEIGTAKSVLYQPQHEYTKSLLQAAFLMQAGNRESGIGNRESGVVEANGYSPVQKTENGETGRWGEAILRVKDLKQYYSLEGNLLQQFFSKEKNVIKAVDEINFELYPGETLGLVGESGCGKSTLSRTILQLIKPTSGTVEFLGEDLTKLSTQQMRSKRREIQMVFQDPHACLNPLMTVGDSIADALLIHNLASPKEAKIQVEKMLARVGLNPVEEYYRRYPRELSGGQQQRIAIARALITNPKLVICDEPVSMLDATVQTQVLELMLDLKKQLNLTYLFITHDLWVARFFCDRIAVMNSGKIVEIGNTKDLFTNPQHPYTQKLLSAAPSLVSS